MDKGNDRDIPKSIILKNLLFSVNFHIFVFQFHLNKPTDITTYRYQKKPDKEKISWFLTYMTTNKEMPQNFKHLRTNFQLFLLLLAIKEIKSG